MPGNTLGDFFSITTFGESHGVGMGVVIDGCPAGLAIDTKFIQSELNRRRPGQSQVVSAREEHDKVEILSGVYENISTGMPIALFIRNEDHRPLDYSPNQYAFRPSHADYTYHAKYGMRDFRGGGRQSARETVSRVAAGAVAKLLLRKHDVSIQAFVSSIGPIQLNKALQNINFDLTELSPVRCPDQKISAQMTQFLETLKSQGDTTGGVITCIIKNVPVALGEPVFDKLHADLAKAVISINAAKGFEYGSGFSGASMRGSEHNDLFNPDFTTKTNNSGGIQGGISNGEDIYFRVAFKPVSTIFQPQTTTDIYGQSVEFLPKGRHDTCVVPRAVPIVEAMAALVLVDHLLRNKLSKL